MRLPVHVLTGFLGSGKTTLLNRLIAQPGFSSTAVIVNEFGAIGLDHLLVESSADNVVLLDSGCLCCTLGASLQETLADLARRRHRRDIPAFERVVIETTGLADPAPILNTLLGHSLVTDHYRLASTLVTVDSQHAIVELDTQPEPAKQIALADAIVLTKLDVGPADPALADRIAALNPFAPRVDARNIGGVMDTLVGTAARVATAPAARASPVGASEGVSWSHAEAVHASDVHSHCFVLEQPPTWAGIAAWWHVASEAFGNRLLRCKGIVSIRESGQIVVLQTVQGVFHAPERLAEWPDGDLRSRLVCITRGVSADDLRRSLLALDLPEGTPPQLSLADLESKELS